MLGFHSFSSSEHADYRFGFNGQEKDDEIAGNGNSYTAEFWQYDGRLGRRWNLDPKGHPSFSFYSAFSLNPIWFSDQKGDTVTVSGSKRDIRKFTRQLGRRTGNKYGVDEDGNLFTKSKESNIETTKRKSGELSQIVGSVIESEDVIPIDLVRNDANTLMDSYDRGTLDVGDFSMMDRTMQAAMFTHVLVERMESYGYESPSLRTNYMYKASHDVALEAESRVVNAMLGQTYVKVVASDKLITTTNSDGTKNYHFRGTSIYGKYTFQFNYGAKLVTDKFGTKAVPTGTMFTKFKRQK